MTASAAGIILRSMFICTSRILSPVSLGGGRRHEDYYEAASTMSNVTQLQLAGVHEAAHATAALCLMLPLRCVFIRDDGSDGTAYTRRLSWGEVDRWTISAYAGPEAERLIYGDADEAGDLRVIAANCFFLAR